jgi:hypothetical protein
LQWYRIDPSGRTGDLFFSMKLNDAVISAIHRNLTNQRDPALRGLVKSKRFPSSAGASR